MDHAGREFIIKRKGSIDLCFYFVVKKPIEIRPKMKLINQKNNSERNEKEEPLLKSNLSL